MTLEFRNFYFPNRHHTGMDGQTGLTTYPFFSNLFHKQTDLISQLESRNFSAAFQERSELFSFATGCSAAAWLHTLNSVSLNHLTSSTMLLNSETFCIFHIPREQGYVSLFYLFIYFILFFPKKSQIYLETMFYFAFHIAHLGREKTTSICKPSHRPQSSSWAHALW